MLQETHPLVKAALERWKGAPRFHRSRWEQKLSELSMFVSAMGRLPKYCGEKELEGSYYQWLCVQCRRVLSGYLPDEMIQRLLNAHPLIAAHIETSRESEQMKRCLESVCEQVRAVYAAGIREGAGLRSW